MSDISKDLRQVAKCIHLAVEAMVANDVAKKCIAGADEISTLTQRLADVEKDKRRLAKTLLHYARQDRALAITALAEGNAHPLSNSEEQGK